MSLENKSKGARQCERHRLSFASGLDIIGLTLLAADIPQDAAMFDRLAGGGSHGDVRAIQPCPCFRARVLFINGQATEQTVDGRPRMPTSAIDSLVFRNMFGDSEVRQIWSDEYRTQCYLDWEAALARAQAGLGLIPQDAATEINRVCKLENIDFSRLEEESLNIGYPVLGVVHQIGRLCRGDAGNWCHWGATTQDVTDSATVFQIRASFDIIANKLDEAIAATANLARDHRDLPMAGRSNLQQAVPITFGFKMARLLATILRHRDRLKEIRPRIEVFEFGGACGTLASLGEKGLAVQEALAREFGLAQPDIAWHTERDRIAEAGCFLGLLTGTLAKFATDLKLMMQTEVGED